MNIRDNEKTHKKLNEMFKPKPKKEFKKERISYI